MRALLVIALVSALAGCSDEEISEGTTTQSIVTGNKITANKITANKLAANKLAANPEAVGDLLNTADGRDVLSFMVSCAIPDGTIIVATAEDGTVYEFLGGVGLAPSWAHHPLDEVGKRWISACLFARVNAHGVAVTISLRGPNHALEVSPEEAAGWPLEEGAFYGNYFTPPQEPIIWIACRGRDQAAGETGGLIDRDCAEPDPMTPGSTQCGFTFAGDCADFAPPAHAFACDELSDQGFYVGCSDHAVSDPRENHHRGERFNQVITTYVTR